MWETIAMWGGVAGLFVSIFAVIILYLTRKNILDILDKDVILFGRNFEIKKQVLTNACLLIDEVIESEGRIKSNSSFTDRAKKSYNELLCVVSDVKVADEFYSLTLENVEFSLPRFAQFKIMCRKDIGLRTKKAQTVKRASNKSNEMNTSNNSNTNQTPQSGPQNGGRMYESNTSQQQANQNLNQQAINAPQNRIALQNQSNSNPSDSTSQTTLPPRRPTPQPRSTAIPANNQIRRPYPADEGND